MGKYVAIKTQDKIDAEAAKDLAFAKFLKDKKLNADTIGVCLEVKMPDSIRAELEAEGIDGAAANEAVSRLMQGALPKLLEHIPSIVRKRMKPPELLEILADECAAAVYAIPLELVGEEFDPIYRRLADVVCENGEMGTMLTMGVVCAQTHSKAVKLAESREDMPDIDPARAQRATHKSHATVQ